MEPETQIEQGSFECFIERFEGLRKEAFAFGVESMTVLRHYDRFDSTERFATGWTGGTAVAYGLTKAARRALDRSADPTEEPDDWV